MHLERNYHESRIMFAILNNNLHYLDGDKRGHLEWLRNDFNITDGEFNEITRGYIRNGTIAVYKGFKFSAVSKKSLINTINLIIREFNLDLNEYIIFNGVLVGNIGEIWKPLIEYKCSDFIALLGEEL
mgnify:CR=1 FL=1